MRLPPRTLILSAAISVAVLFVLTLVSPSYALSKKQDEQAGAVLFRDKGCAYCHGMTGLGTAKGPSLDKVRKTMKPSQIADQIKNGGQKMPSFQDSLNEGEVLQLVSYLRARHRPLAAPVVLAPASATKTSAMSNPAQ